MRRRVGEIRRDFPDTLVLVRSGNFYRCYDDDSYILAYLMDYQVKTTVISDMAGFPVDSLRKVIDRFEANRINYKIFEYNSGTAKLVEEADFKENNCYEEVFGIAERYVRIKQKISNLSDILLRNIENEKIEIVISKISQLIYNDL